MVHGLTFGRQSSAFLVRKRVAAHAFLHIARRPREEFDEPSPKGMRRRAWRLARRLCSSPVRLALRRSASAQRRSRPPPCADGRRLRQRQPVPLRAAEARLRGGAAQSARAERHRSAAAPQSIALSMVQWTGPFLQVAVLPWTLIKDEASIMSAASADRKHPAPAVRRRHLDLGRDRLRHGDVPAEPVQGRAAGDRHLRRRLQQWRPLGDPRARRGGRRRMSPSTGCRSSRSSPTSISTTATT